MADQTPTPTPLQPMVDAYRLWATNRMSASEFGNIADQAILAFQRVAPVSQPETTRPDAMQDTGGTEK